MKDKSINLLIELLNSYGVKLTKVSTKRNTINYYVELTKPELVMSVEDTLDNVNKILYEFTNPDNMLPKEIKINLFYKIEEGEIK